MATPVIASKIAADILGGPLLDILGLDPAERSKLTADLAGQLETAVGKLAESQEKIVAAEAASEHWLTRSWRPLLMVVLTGLLTVVGLLLPFAEALAGHQLAFRPRWDLLPPEFWSFITLGMGGYIGGRSLEKIAGSILGKAGSRMRD